MRFVRLEAENFKSFEKFSVELDGHGFVKIDGLNNTDEFSESVGSGKSTIADALSYALTGETVKGNSSMSDVKNMYTNGKCLVSIEFENEGKSYIIRRGESELTIVEDGVDISKHLKRETQQLIEQKFPYFTPTFIGATVIIGQNMPNAFTNNKPSARKQILEELTNSSFMIEDIKTRLADKKNEWQTEMADLSAKKVAYETKIDSCNRTIETANSRLNSLRPATEIESEISKIEDTIKEFEYKSDAYNETLREVFLQKEAMQSKVEECQSLLDEEVKAHNEFVSKSVEGMLKEKSKYEIELASVRSEYKAKNSEISRLKDEIQRLKNTPTHCPTCKQALPDAHTIDTTDKEKELGCLILELDNLRNTGEKLAQKVEPIEEKISSFKLENESNEKIDNLRSNIRDLKHSLQKLSLKESETQCQKGILDSGIKDGQLEISKLRVSLSEIETVRKTCKEDIVRSKAEIAEYENGLKETSALYDKATEKMSTLNQIISFATRDFRTILLSSIICRLDAYAKSYCKKMLDTTEIEFKDDGNNISITYRGRDFGVLSGGESQVVKMCITLALKKTLEDLVGFTTNLMFFDEILDNCDKSTAQQLIELVSSLELSSTFFVSHHDDVYLPMDKSWLVTKTNRISALNLNPM